MSTGYLEVLDTLLADGLGEFSPAFRARQAAFVAAGQRADGGFPGRQGASDAYYTDFAVRVLALCAPESPALPAAGAYLTRLTSSPADVVEGFSRLNAWRLLAQCGVSAPMATSGILARVEAQRLPTGGYARRGAPTISVYQTFLAALSHDILDRPVSDIEQTAAALLALQCADGGFSEGAGEQAGQTSATAAALAVLTMLNRLEEATAARAIDFLLAQQAADGGFLAHAGAPYSDGLSTFTALLSLTGLGAQGRADLAGGARFVKGAALPAGGFCAGAFDHEPDSEYTYYGIGVLALLRLAARG